MKRFIVYPGTVRSQSDGQEHFISGGRLIELYGLDSCEVVIHIDAPGAIYDPELLPLYPRADGRYREHLERQKTEDFREYYRIKKLHDFHASGRSPKPRELQRLSAQRLAKSMAWHEKHWPDFPAAYERMSK